MCPLTPTIKGGDNSSTQNSSTQCSNSSNNCNNNNNNNNNGSCLKKTSASSEMDKETLLVRQRKNVETETTSSSVNHIQDIATAKALGDNLGYKEENAVYKERQQHKEEAQSKLSDGNVVAYKPRIRWPDLMAQLFLHVGGLYGFYLLFSAKLYTFFWVVLILWGSGIGITAGAHRLWSHKSYTASLPLRIILVFLFTIAGQRDAYTWALDHRIHHKFSESDADPHDARRGFFFAHVGWLFLTPNPKVEEKRKVIDMSDLENDKVVMFQRKWFIPLFALCSILLPVGVPCYYWQEDIWKSFWINFNMRFCCTLNVAFFVNSVAHMWGRKPYDKSIQPVESPIVSFLALGEGWHNYHHVFPWDYKTGEFGNYSLNMTTLFIDLCAKFGWVKGRKSVSSDMVKRRATKCGDGTRFLDDDFAHKDQCWGYGDKDIPKDDAEELAKMQN